MFDSCPARIVGYGIPAQSRVRLIGIVSIRWHRVHTCQSRVLASHRQTVIAGLRDNARRLCPRTELSKQYVFPFASQFQLVWKLQHFRKSLDLACVQHRVDVRFYGNAQQLFRLRAALEQYVFPLRFILSQYCDGKLVRSLH